MSKFVWSAAYDVFNDKLNNEHIEIIACMEKLEVLNKTTFNKDKVLDTLTQLIQITQTHFKDEEAYLKEIKYPNFDVHQQIHTQLIQTLEAQKKEFEIGVSGRLPAAVFDFFSNWIKTHILMVDTQYAKFHQNNLKEKQSTLV